jgi:hypothetical protein
MLKSIQYRQLALTAALCLAFSGLFIWLDSPSSSMRTFLLVQSRWTIAGDIAVLWVAVFYATVVVTLIRCYESVRSRRIKTPPHIRPDADRFR